MFIEEARLASRLGHANVVQVFEFDQVDGRYYIAMELVRGHHLGRVVERARERGVRLGLPRAVHAGAEIAKALAYAHRLSEGGRPLGLVHRDVSPHNVLVSFEGEVKLADFGIARAMGQTGLTAPGTLKGKLAYMAPEQARERAAWTRAPTCSRSGSSSGSSAPDGGSSRATRTRRRSGRCSGTRSSRRRRRGTTRCRPSWTRRSSRRSSAISRGGHPLRGGPRARARPVLLRMTRSPADVDLRAFMHALWPEGLAPAPVRSGRGSVRSPSRPSRSRARRGCRRRLRPRCEAEASASPGWRRSRPRGPRRRARAGRRRIEEGGRRGARGRSRGRDRCGSGRDEGEEGDPDPTPTPTPIPTGSPSAVHPERIADAPAAARSRGTTPTPESREVASPAERRSKHARRRPSRRCRPWSRSGSRRASTASPFPRRRRDREY